MPLESPTPPPALVAPCGPQLPRLKGGAAPGLTFAQQRAIRLALMEMGGAVVVVEGDAPLPILPRWSGVELLGGRLKLRPGALPVNGAWVPVPAWMDPNVVCSNPNAATRTYTFLGAGL